MPGYRRSFPLAGNEAVYLVHRRSARSRLQNLSESPGGDFRRSEQRSKPLPLLLMPEQVHSLSLIWIKFLKKPTRKELISTNHKSNFRLFSGNFRCYNIPTLKAAGKQLRKQTKLFTLIFEGIYIMKNIFTKNLVKSISEYGEQLNRIGC